MFLKPIKIRSQHQLKTSDKKRFVQELCKNLPSLTNENVESLFPKKEELLLLKIETGSKLLIPVYVVQEQPIIFIYNQIFIPTLHMLTKCPNAVVVFKTHTEVLKKLVTGADLMLPGVIELSAATFCKDTPASVSLYNGTATVAVGVTTVSSNDLVNSTKGKCVQTLHVIGDKLYHLKNTSNNIPSPLEELISTLKVSTIEDSSTTLENEKVTDVVQEESLSEDNEGEGTDSVKEMDDLLIYTLCVAIKYSKGLTLPILTSNFFKLQMVAACPETRTLDVKKSSFKKCGTFMKHMMELGVIKVEEQKKGIETITEFNFDHPFISEFYLNPELRPKTTKDLENSVKPIINEAHSVTAAVLPIFAEFNFKKGSVIDNSEIRKLVTEYVKRHNLQDGNNKSLVRVDNALRPISFMPLCSFEELIRGVYNLMSPCYKIVCGDTEIIHKGKLEPINITVAKRSGNKKVTLVDNVETYGININQFGNICQHGVAASTTIIRSENLKKGSQLLIQGNQVLFVYNLLTEKCLIPKRYVRGLEFAPKK